MSEQAPSLPRRDLTEHQAIVDNPELNEWEKIYALRRLGNNAVEHAVTEDKLPQNAEFSTVEIPVDKIRRASEAYDRAMHDKQARQENRQHLQEEIANKHHDGEGKIAATDIFEREGIDFPATSKSRLGMVLRKLKYLRHDDNQPEETA